MAEQENELRIAAKNGDNATVTKLLAAGVAQKPDEAGETPLLLCTQYYMTDPKYVEVVRSLLDAGANVNAKNKDGDAPIHNAASNGNLEMMELLLDYGGDLVLEGEMGMVPLGLAATKKHHAVVNLVVQKLAEENKFSEKQVEWMNKAENETQQLHIYRALTVVLQIKTALIDLLRFGVIPAILKGMKKFSKKSIQTSGLQLLQVIIADKDGLEEAKKANIKDAVTESCKVYDGDAVVQHLVNEVIGKL